MSIFRRVFRLHSKKKQAPTETPTINADIERQHILSLRKRAFPTFTQLRYIPQYLSRNERFLLRFFALLILACGLTIGIRFVQSNIVWVPQAGGTYTEGLVGFPRYINPVLAIGSNTDSELTKLFFPGLIATDQYNTIVPDLAESYAISEDAKTFTFVLRENLNWDDGEALTMDDVMFTFTTIQDSAYASPWAYVFRNATFEQVDDRTLKVTLKDPSSQFLRYMTIGILPLHRYSDVIPANFTLTEDNTRPVGAGPYKFKSMLRARTGEIRSMILERNPLYHGNKPYLDELRFKFYPDIELALQGMKSREIQGLAFVPPWYESQERKIRGSIQQKLVIPQETVLFFNLKNDLFDKKELRQALAFGVDREQIIRDVMGGQALVADGPFISGFIGSIPNYVTRQQDLDQANALLDSAGYPRKEDGMRKRGDGNLRLVITTIDQAPYPEVTNIIKENWEQLGIEVEVQLVEPARLLQDVLKPRRYDLLLYGELFDQALDPYAFWHSSQALDPGLNLSIFVNKRVDQLLDEARKETSEESIHAKYQEMHNIIADQLPAIFLFTPVYDYLIPDDMHGMPEGNLATPENRFDTVTSWYRKTTPTLKGK